MGLAVSVCGWVGVVMSSRTARASYCTTVSRHEDVLAIQIGRGVSAVIVVAVANRPIIWNIARRSLKHNYSFFQPVVCSTGILDA